MPVMPFEGLCEETLEDVYGEGVSTEPTHSDEDEAWYCAYVLSGEADEYEADYYAEREDNYDPDGWQVGQDRWERHFWGD